MFPQCGNCCVYSKLPNGGRQVRRSSVAPTQDLQPVRLWCDNCYTVEPLHRHNLFFPALIVFPSRPWFKLDPDPEPDSLCEELHSLHCVTFESDLYNYMKVEPSESQSLWGFLDLDVGSAPLQNDYL